MANTYYKRVSSHGSINIPRAMRAEMGLEERSPVEVTVEDNRIVVRPYTLRCAFCGTAEGVREYKNRGICSGCFGMLKEEMGWD